MPETPSGTLCPSCGEFIPAAAPGCSRCGYDTRQGPAAHTPPPPTSVYAAPAAHPYVPRSSGGVFIRDPDLDKPIWQDTAFKVVSIVILIQGILEVLLGGVALLKSGGSDGGSSLGHGLIMTMVGVGLLAEWSWASVVLKISCWLNLLLGIGITLGGLFMISGTPLGWLVAGIGAVFVAMYGFVLYLVNTVGLD